jgi:predicted negative regulator of RcsB-dependent stress response
MDEDISIINKNTRNEKIKNFFINNKKSLISTLIIIILILFGYFAYEEIQSRKKIKLAEKYNQISNKFILNKNKNVINEFVEIINEKDSTYSPLALYFIIDNELEAPNEEINKYFDIMINDLRLEKEIKNLIIYKKGLFNSDFETENNLFSILNPIINSESVWKSHALYLMAEFFIYKNQKQKAKEFYNQILSDKNSNENLRKEARKRLSRDFSE